ncbi:C1q-related factor-like [Argopecten irradians]|uniref:C1q-related factor-like n=1 Tax=Argopecten irradians TaxID=31199 RepID=UPI003714E37C
MARFFYLVVGILVLYIHDTSGAPNGTIDQSSVSIEQRVTVLERTIHGLQTQNQQLVDCVMNVSSDYIETVKCARAIITAGLSFGRQVMFFAQLNHHLSNVAVEQVIVFENVVTNVGNCYSGHTGVFTCCKSGTYFFSWIIDLPTGVQVNTELMVNSSSIALNRAGDANNYSTGSMSAVIHLDIGDEVRIRIQFRTPASSHIRGEKTSSFSGFLIQ